MLIKFCCLKKSSLILAQGENNLDQDFGYQLQTPDIEIKKFVNGEDANTAEDAVEIIPGEDAIFTYEVTNTGNVPFAASEVIVTDDNGTPDDNSDDFNPTFNVSSDVGGDGILSPGEIWLYSETLAAQDLLTVTNTIIDFETDGEGNPLSAGTIIDDEYQNLGLTVSATQFGAMLFDSANPTGGDLDLSIPGLNNILIISEDGDSSDPDDNAGGGKITFTLDNPVDFNSIDFVDIEESGGTVVTTDIDGNITTTSIPNPGDNSFKTLTINDDNVVKVEVNLVGSGAISGLDFDTITDGIYTNIGKVVADGVMDDDPANYVNPDLNPGIDIEKFTNDIDADTPEEAAEILPGETVTWTYKVTNTGNVPFELAEVVVTDDQGVIPLFDSTSDVGNDGILSPNEMWIYTASGVAETLTTSGTETTTFNLSGNSGLDGTDGNIRTFSADGISVNASAFSRSDGGSWAEAFLGSFSGGLGVTDTSEGDGSNGLHRVDNIGRDNYVLFEFSESVIVDRTFLDSVVNDSDITVWIGNVDEAFNSHNTLNDAFLSGLEFSEDDYTGSSSSRWANINDGEVVGNVLVIAASTSDETPEDRFKIEKIEVQQVETGIYKNIGTVEVPDATDSDPSHYVNPNLNPGIDIEKFTNGVDVVHIPDDLPELAPGDHVTFTYEVTNTGNVPFAASDVVVKDDNGTPGDTSDDFNPVLVSGDDGNNILEPGETWVYEQTETVQDLSSSTNQDITFVFTGNSNLDGPNGNIRTFTQNDVSLDVSAFSRTSSGTWNQGYLGSYSGGLGVTNIGESGSSHRVDNGGRVDYILFEFDEDVIVDQAYLNYVVNDSDISVWIGDRNGSDIINLSDSLLNNFTKENNFTNHGNSRWADFNNGEVVGDTIVISAYTGHSNDAFKLNKLDISVPSVTSGIYQNIGTVTADGISDSDISGYINSIIQPE